MRVRLVHVSRDRRGRPARRVEALEVEALRVGRATDNHVQLQALAVALHHLVLHRREDGLALEPLARAEVFVNGRLPSGGPVRPGDTLRVGPFELRLVAPEGDAEVELEVERTPAARAEPEGRAEALRGRLPRGLLSPALLSAAAGLVVIVLGLGLPLAAGRFRAAWSTGTLSQAHGFVERDCEQCHARVFVSVRDDACLGCHAEVGAHTTAATFREFLGDRRCASCHPEHNGRLGLARGSEALCAECHSEPHRTWDGEELAAATDFGDDHPAFRASLLNAEGEGVRRVELSPSAREESGLLFDHLRHVGQFVTDPETGEKRLQTCEECHVLEPGGRGFAPVEFEGHCQACHSIAFEGAREALHGDPAAMRVDMLEFYAAQVLDAGPARESGRSRARPGSPPTPEMRRAADLLRRERMQRASDFLMSGEDRKAPCATCHTIQSGGPSDGGTGVAPVRATDRFLPLAEFAHQTHGAFACARCHPAAAVFDPEFAPERARPAHTQDGTHALLTPDELRSRHGLEPSRSADDLLLPEIATCRECHAGARTARRDAVPSECGLCHPFHRPERGAMREALVRRAR